VQDAQVPQQVGLVRPVAGPPRLGQGPPVIARGGGRILEGDGRGAEVVQRGLGRDRVVAELGQGQLAGERRPRVGRAAEPDERVAQVAQRVTLRRVVAEVAGVGQGLFK
jgi:hypothetical protein